MLKAIKILTLLTVIIMSLSVTVFASEIDMNLTSSETYENTADIDATSSGETTSQPVTNSLTLPSTTSGNINGSAAPSSVSSIAQENMSFSNILNILVITVGVIIILLGIAILIRLK